MQTYVVGVNKTNKVAEVLSTKKVEHGIVIKSLFAIFIQGLCIFLQYTVFALT